MSSPVISVRGLGKKYRLGETIRHDTLRDKIAHSLKTLFAKKENSEARSAKREAHPKLPSAPRSELHVPQSPPVSPAPRSALCAPPSADFWALKDVSFDVQQGEVVGIIGRNGAGKSTLLKILSQITEPTEGEIRMRGRVASLLEVGTGFHPELTGRENIFLNGAILGMARSEIRKKFDEIVAFAEVEKFIDTPVKRYSSGMYVRLAFAVAAHLEPEILIVDEVLAVGDSQFQKKCLGKMQDVSAKEGRTVLFVSHNMEAVRSLCPIAVLLQSGRLAHFGATSQVINKYLREGSAVSGEVFFDRKHTSPLEFISLRVTDVDGKVASDVDACKPFIVELVYEVTSVLDNVEIAIRFFNNRSIPVTTTISTDGLPQRSPMKLHPGLYSARITVPATFLMPDDYTLSPGAFQFSRRTFDHQDNALRFRVIETGTSVSKYNHHSLIGVVLNNFPWINEALP